MPLCLGEGKFCNVGPCRSKLRASFWSSLAASMFGQLQGTGLASQTYDFRLHFWDRFLGSFLNASSSKVTTSTPHFRNHNVGPNHLDYLSGWFVLPSLRPDLLPLFEFLFQSRSADPKIGPMHSIIRMQSAYMPLCLGEGQILQCRSMSQQATCKLLV